LHNYRVFLGKLAKIGLLCIVTEDEIDFVQSYTSPVLFKVEFFPVAVSFLFWSSTAQLGVILSYKQTTKTEKCTRNTTLRSTKASCLFRHLV